MCSLIRIVGSLAVALALQINVAHAQNAAPVPAAASATARNPAATVSLVDGNATLVAPDKTSHAVHLGDVVREGDAIITTESAEVHLDMADGGFVAVRPNTSMSVSRYQANGTNDDHSVIALLKGSLRSITGWIGKSQPRNYAINTPSATIGVRGTDHEPAYIPEGTPGADAGTYDTVHEGGTTVATRQGKIDVTPERAGFAGVRGNLRPRLLERVPEFFRVARRHDDVFVGKHALILAGLEKKRAERRKQFISERRHPGARAGEAAKHAEANVEDRHPLRERQRDERKPRRRE